MGLQEMFGSMVFNDDVMRQRLPKETYRALHRTIAEGKSLNMEVASVVANTMKDWVIEKGATHYTHWFQPMTGITAEKHDSFISPTGDGVINSYMPDMSAPGAVKTGEVELVAGVALKNTLKAAVLKDIAIAAAT